MFENREAFRVWLNGNRNRGEGVWMIFGKTGKVETISPDEALEEALCFGWIDGMIKSVDDTKYMKTFTPRRKGSKWSERNRKLFDKLVEAGKMTESGFAAAEEAKKSGNWDAPQGNPITDDQVEVLVQALKVEDKALSNFLKMSPSVKRTYTALYFDAKKEETRVKRLQWIIGRLNENKKPM